jgi:hypothetical protein
MKLSCACAIVAVLSSAALAEEDEPTLAPAGDNKLPSTAIDERKDDEGSDGARYLLATGEILTVLGLSAAWYWNDLELQRPDWVLKWDADSWEDKLTSTDPIRFDTNEFHINLGHTTQALSAYGIGRGNGFGMSGAAALNVAYTFVWEYMIEFREYPSLNDLIVNSMSGPALAEPLWQIGDYFRSGPKTTINEGLAAFFQPFDEIERHVNHRKWRESARPWHRFQIFAGTSTESGQTDGTLGADLEVVSFDRSGASSGWTPAGGWSRIAGGVDYGEGGLGQAWLLTHTSYFGYQSRTKVDEGIGHSEFIGVGTGITYVNEKLAMERDQFAAFHLIGPQTDISLRTQNFDIRLQAAAYGDLGMVHSMAIGAMPPIDPEPPFESPLTRPDGYYFGVGPSVWTHLIVERGRAHADLEAHAHQLWSIDQKNADRGEPPPPQNLADGRFYGQLTLGYDLVEDRLSLDTQYQLSARRGTVEDGMGLRTNREQEIDVLLTLQH